MTTPTPPLSPAAQAVGGVGVLLVIPHLRTGHRQGVVGEGVGVPVASICHNWAVFITFA